MTQETKILYSGIFFPDSGNSSDLHVTYCFKGENSVLPHNIIEGERCDIFIYAMLCDVTINAIACYTHLGKETLSHQVDGKTPLHITLTHGKGIPPVESGIRLRHYSKESSKKRPNMNGYHKFDKLEKWQGVWGFMRT